MVKKIAKYSLVFLLSICMLLSSACSKPEYKYDDGEGELYQRMMPEIGDQIAIIHTNLGDFTVRLFPDEAPRAVENFVKLAQSGYYDGCIFFKIEHDFFIQSGDPTNTGTGGQSYWGKDFKDEYSSMLHHIYGALAMARGENPNTNRSQFFFVTNKNISHRWESDFSTEQAKNPALGYTQKVQDAYLENGGAPWLDQVSTVFGQVVIGLNIMDKIARQEIDENGKPITDVVITTIEITTYQG